MISNRKYVGNALRTNSAHDGDSEPVTIHSSQGVHVTEAVPEGCKRVVGNEYCLRKFNDINAVDEIFCESSVVRKC